MKVTPRTRLKTVLWAGTLHNGILSLANSASRLARAHNRRGKYEGHQDVIIGREVHSTGNYFRSRHVLAFKRHVNFHGSKDEETLLILFSYGEP